MNVDIIRMMQEQLNSLGVQMLLLSEPYDNLDQFDYQFLRQNQLDYDYSRLMDSLKDAIRPGMLLQFQEYFYAHYLFFAFPERLKAEYRSEYCLIGPYLFQPVSTSMFRKFVDAYQITPDRYRDIQEFFNRIPVFPSDDMLRSLLYPYIKVLLGDCTQLYTADSCQKGFVSAGLNEYRLAPSSDISFQTLEERYNAETAFLQAVTAGNTENALTMYHRFVQFRLMPRVADPVRNKKNISFALNTLLRKAVQSAYVHPYHIDNLSTQFAIQIENCTNTSQLGALSLTMIRKYCLLVNNYSRKGYSSLVQMSLDHIDSHYAQELSLDNLSKLCSVTNSYLSSLFKKETGMTITDYINTTRIRQALFLLNTTHLSIQDIALQCGYQDANYFTRTFKRYQKLSPKEYRKKIHGE